MNRKNLTSMPRVTRTAEEEARRNGGEFIESLDRGLRVLQSFGTEHRPMTLSDIAKASNRNRVLSPGTNGCFR